MFDIGHPALPAMTSGTNYISVSWDITKLYTRYIPGTAIFIYLVYNYGISMVYTWYISCLLGIAIDLFITSALCEFLLCVIRRCKAWLPLWRYNVDEVANRWCKPLVQLVTATESSVQRGKTAGSWVKRVSAARTLVQRISLWDVACNAWQPLSRRCKTWIPFNLLDNLWNAQHPLLCGWSYAEVSYCYIDLHLRLLCMSAYSCISSHCCQYTAWPYAGVPNSPAVEHQQDQNTILIKWYCKILEFLKSS